MARLERTPTTREYQQLLFILLGAVGRLVDFRYPGCRFDEATVDAARGGKNLDTSLYPCLHQPTRFSSVDSIPVSSRRRDLYPLSAVLPPSIYLKPMGHDVIEQAGQIESVLIALFSHVKFERQPARLGQLDEGADK